MQKHTGTGSGRPNKYLLALGMFSIQLTNVGYNVVALIAVVGVVRCFVSKMRNPLRSFDTIVNQHIYAALLVTYVVLPTVSSLQFRAMDCQTMPHDGSSFLRVDSAIDCNTPSYKFFSTVVALGIVLYQSIPLCWLVLLWRVRPEVLPRMRPSRTIPERA